MQTQNRLLDDLAKVASSAMGAAAGVRGEVEARIREQFERILIQMDLVPREEFDVVKEVAAKAREDSDRLIERVAELEARLEALEGAKPAAKTKAAASKSATSKSAASKSTAAKTKE